MAKDSPWFRRNVDALQSDWLAALPWASRAVWDEICGWVKLTGRRGRCRALSVQRFAGAMDIPSENVRECLQAAIAFGALVEKDGWWTIPTWEDYNPTDETNAERQRRFREKNNPPSSNGSVTESNGVTENHNELPCHATETITDTVTNTPPLISPPGEPVFGDEKLEAKWQEWLKYRKEQRVKTTQTTLDKQIAFLKTQPDPIAVLEQSMLSGYRGLFPLKATKPPPRSTSPPRRSTEELARLTS